MCSSKMSSKHTADRSFDESSYGVFYLLFRMTFGSNMFGVLEGAEHPQKTQAKVLNANTVSSGNKHTQTPNLL